CPRIGAGAKSTPANAAMAKIRTGGRNANAARKAVRATGRSSAEARAPDTVDRARNMAAATRARSRAAMVGKAMAARAMGSKAAGGVRTMASLKAAAAMSRA